jgi:hypothetical protein
MLESTKPDLLASLSSWLRDEAAVKAAVLFGSRARQFGLSTAADEWSDIDLHVITAATTKISEVNWKKALPQHHYIFHTHRPATGGVTKLTVLFSEGEVDFVLIPRNKMRIAALAMTLGLHVWFGGLRAALNNMATIMSGGYYFIKGENKWKHFYERVVTQMPGVRITDSEASNIASNFICDLLWIFQKLERGELVAAQRHLHKSLAESNIVLLHELRLRQNLPTFQQARRVERLLTPPELKIVQVDAVLDVGRLRLAAWRTFNGFQVLMKQLVPEWELPLEVSDILVQYRPPSESFIE